jgi:hypothetical protein
MPSSGVAFMLYHSLSSKKTYRKKRSGFVESSAVEGQAEVDSKNEQQIRQ